MIIVKGHLHADIVYGPMSARHYWYLLKGLVWGKWNGCRTVTTHLPLEIMHPRIYKGLERAKGLIRFGEYVKKVLGISLCWENAPLLNYGVWDLKYGQMEWGLVPENIDLCLDTGHLILGSKDVREARGRIGNVLMKRGGQIKHLHIHENDFKTDQHKKPNKVLNKEVLGRVMKGRSYIFEKG